MKSATGFAECTAEHPCFGCGHTGYCTRSADGHVSLCRRGVESAHPVKQRDGSTAYLHRYNGATAPIKITPKLPGLKLSVSALRERLKQYRTALSPNRLDRLAASLGLTPESLRAFGVGYAIEQGAYTFPMYDGDRRPCGIRLRGIDGKKSCVVGSRNGLFIPDAYEPDAIPAGIADDEFPLLLLLPEGPTDAAAAYVLGFKRSVGRPSNIGGQDQLRRLLDAGGIRQDVVIVADNDETKYLPDGTPFWPGIEGGVAVAEAILAVCGKVRFVLPPAGVKDLRKWLNDGGHAAIFAALKAAPVVNANWINAAKRRLKFRKRDERRKRAG